MNARVPWPLVVYLVVMAGILATMLLDIQWPGPMPSEAWIEAFNPGGDSLVKGLPRW